MSQKLVNDREMARKHKIGREKYATFPIIHEEDMKRKRIFYEIHSLPDFPGLLLGASDTCC